MIFLRKIKNNIFMKNIQILIIRKLGIAIAIAFFFKIVFFRLEHFFDPDLLFMIAIVLIIWYGNNTIDKGLNKKLIELLLEKRHSKEIHGRNCKAFIFFKKK